MRAATAGRLTVYPCGTTPPQPSLAFPAARSVAVTTLVAVDPLSGRICLMVDHSVVVRVDVIGWAPERGGVHVFASTRLFDTRSRVGLRPVATGRLVDGRVLRVHVAGLTGRVPASGVEAVVAHLTVVGADGRGSLQAWSCGARARVASMVFDVGDTVSALAILPVDPRSGDTCLITTRTTHVAADVVGWLETGRGWSSTAARLVDTRPGMPARSTARGPVTAARPMLLPLAGLLPAGTTVAVVTVTATVADGSGTLTLASCDGRPSGSVAPVVVSFDGVRLVSTTALVGVDAGASRWCLRATRAVHVVIDLVGTARIPDR
jgi:hypothetical protein